MHLSRTLRLAAASAGLLLLGGVVAPTSPASAVGNLATGAMEVTLHFATPIPPGQCIETAYTVTGTIAGTLTIGAIPYAGVYTMDGASRTDVAEGCQSASYGSHYAVFELSGTDALGHVVVCPTVSLVYQRWSPTLDIGGIRGDCTIDGSPVGEVSGGFTVGVSRPVPEDPTQPTTAVVTRTTLI
jgi:hypothetical protein